MPKIPRDTAIDSTLSILLDGYDFIWKRCRRLQTDVFRTRVMGLPTVCVHGRDAAALFYDESKLKREHALPRRVVTTLFGKHAVQTLDDQAHRTRKAAFLSLMGTASMERLMEITAAQWRQAIRRWERAEQVVLFDETQRILTASVCEWAGVPVKPGELGQRAQDFASMVDAFGGVGPRLWQGKLARVRAQAWLMRLISNVRRGRALAAPGTALHVMAHHRDDHGKPLGLRTAAVELINVLRPTMAVSWYITFAALALHEHPEARQRIASEPAGSGEYADLFMQEVRRFYPFAPFLGALVRQPFEWKGYAFTPGTMVLLDVYGNHHDPMLWREPARFWPERFKQWSGDAYDFIPQGGGDRSTSHRCPGEWITMHNITLALHFLTRCMSYELAPQQDLSFSLSRMPTQPRSGLVLRNVQGNAMLDAEAPRLPSRTAAQDGVAAGRVEPARRIEALH